MGTLTGGELKMIGTDPATTDSDTTVGFGAMNLTGEGSTS
jgi:hypothetical protein